MAATKKPKEENVMFKDTLYLGQNRHPIPMLNNAALQVRRQLHLPAGDHLHWANTLVKVATLK